MYVGFEVVAALVMKSTCSGYNAMYPLKINQHFGKHTVAILRVEQLAKQGTSEKPGGKQTDVG
jgi:hypothetical protein